MMRTMNENDFVNLSQFSSQESASRNDKTTFTIRNKISHRDGKNLNNQHMIVKDFSKRSFEFKLESLHSEENGCLYCKTYQYNNECHEIKRKTKY